MSGHGQDFDNHPIIAPPLNPPSSSPSNASPTQNTDTTPALPTSISTQTQTQHGSLTNPLAPSPQTQQQTHSQAFPGPPSSLDPASTLQPSPSNITPNPDDSSLVSTQIFASPSFDAPQGLPGTAGASEASVTSASLSVSLFPTTSSPLLPTSVLPSPTPASIHKNMGPIIGGVIIGSMGILLLLGILGLFLWRRRRHRQRTNSVDIAGDRGWKAWRCHLNSVLRPHRSEVIDDATVVGQIPVVEETPRQIAPNVYADEKQAEDPPLIPTVEEVTDSSQVSSHDGQVQHLSAAVHSGSGSGSTSSAGDMAQGAGPEYEEFLYLLHSAFEVGQCTHSTGHGAMGSTAQEMGPQEQVSLSRPWDRLSRTESTVETLPAYEE